MLQIDERPEFRRQTEAPSRRIQSALSSRVVLIQNDEASHQRWTRRYRLPAPSALARVYQDLAGTYHATSVSDGMGRSENHSGAAHSRIGRGVAATELLFFRWLRILQNRVR